eukprot:1148333-Pelagomonas_calceolata.AAC.1
MAAAIAAYSARHMVLEIPAPLGSTKIFAVSEKALDTCSNFLCTILDMTTSISVHPGAPVRDLGREDGTR